MRAIVYNMHICSEKNFNKQKCEAKASSQKKSKCEGMKKILDVQGSTNSLRYERTMYLYIRAKWVKKEGEVG